MVRSQLARRRFLQAAGVSLALPVLESLTPTTARASRALPARRRMVAILYPLSFYPPNFFPEQTGGDYQPTRYLNFLEPFRRDFTVFSGLSHPRVAQAHAESESVFLTGCPVEGRIGGASAFRNTVSLDQFAAAHLGDQTRFPTLNVGNLSYLPSGGRVPGMTKPSEFFAKLFLSGNQEQRLAHKQRLQNGRSILDFVADQAKDMKRSLPPRDGDKLEEYLTSVRDAEKRIGTMLEWEDAPKPQTDARPPVDVPQKEKPFEFLQLMLDLVVLALKHDSSRLITVHAGFMGTQPQFNGGAVDYHNLSHHGKLPENLDKLCRLEDETMTTFARFLKQLTDSQEEGETLLNRTMVLLGSNLGNANTHETTNLPVLLAGGGFKHGRHLSFSREHNTPLCNLYTSMLQRLGVGVDNFGSGTGTLTGLDFS